MQLKNVVLPAPFGPITLAMVRRGTTRSTWLTAVSPPNRLVRSRVSSTASTISITLRAGSQDFGHSLLDGGCLLVQLKLQAAALGGPDTLRAEHHHRHQQRTEDKHAVHV